MLPEHISRLTPHHRPGADGATIAGRLLFAVAAMAAGLERERRLPGRARLSRRHDPVRGSDRGG
jgi:hypothetical protein